MALGLLQAMATEAIGLQNRFDVAGKINLDFGWWGQIGNDEVRAGDDPTAGEGQQKNADLPERDRDGQCAIQ